MAFVLALIVSITLPNNENIFRIDLPPNLINRFNLNSNIGIR